MSILIRVEKVTPIEVGLILQEVSEILKLILGLIFNPALMAVERLEPERNLPESYCIEPAIDDVIGIKSVEEQAIVSVSLYKIEQYAYISPNGWRTGFEYALAAAVAIALARYSGSVISDSALAYTKEFSQSPDEFAQAVKVEGTYYSISEATEAFVAKLGWV
jgi:hypothetical protein